MFFRNTGTSTGCPRRDRRRRRPGLEALEGRQLLSLGAEFQVNSSTSSDQFEARTAIGGNGSVVVWTDFTTSSDHVIRAQLFNSFQQKLGPSIVLEHIGRDDTGVQPAVAMSPQGSFVVTWTQPKGSDTDVLAQVFNANGKPFSPLIFVGSGTFKEHDPSVAIDAFGAFVVSYTRDTDYGSLNPDVFAKRFNLNGQLLNVINVAISSKAEGHSSVAMTPDGHFAVAYQLQYSSTDDDVYLNQYSSSGALLDTVAVAISTAREQLPSVSLDVFGNAVVAYQKLVGSSDNIEARRVSSGGALGGEITVRGSSDQETEPSVAVLPDGGPFVVAYQDNDHVFVTQVSASNAVVSTADAGSGRSYPSLGMNDHGDYLLTSTSSDFHWWPPGWSDNVRGRFGRLS